MWAARGKDDQLGKGYILIFPSIPVPYFDGWSNFDTFYYPEEIGLNEEDFECVTYENSPIEFSCKPIFKKQLGNE